MIFTACLWLCTDDYISNLQHMSTCHAYEYFKCIAVLHILHIYFKDVIMLNLCCIYTVLMIRVEICPDITFFIITIIFSLIMHSKCVRSN